MSQQFGAEGTSPSPQQIISANWVMLILIQIYADSPLLVSYRPLDPSRICPRHFREASGHAACDLKSTPLAIYVTIRWYHCPNCHWKVSVHPQQCCLCSPGCLCWPCLLQVLSRQASPSTPWSSQAWPPRQAGEQSSLLLILPSTVLKLEIRGWQTFTLKSQGVNYLVSVVHAVTVTTAQLYHCGKKHTGIL